MSRSNELRMENPVKTHQTPGTQTRVNNVIYSLKNNFLYSFILCVLHAHAMVYEWWSGDSCESWFSPTSGFWDGNHTGRHGYKSPVESSCQYNLFHLF